MALEVVEVSISAGGKMVNSGGDGESGDELLGPEKTQRINHMLGLLIRSNDIWNLDNANNINDWCWLAEFRMFCVRRR